ncbi:MAG: amino acid permease [Myxococcota bacterium]|nr:amino acid permease [Myxococcota bacterium]
MAGGGERALRRELGAIAAAAIVINATIGTGIFKKPAEVARQAGSIEASLLVWAAGAAVALAGALCFAELSSSMPRTGGIYEYLRRAWGPRLAFLYGWAKITLLLPSAVGSFALLASESIAALAGWPSDRGRDAVIAVLVIAACAAVNVIGVRASALQQALITSVKYLGVVFLAVLGLLAPLVIGAEVPVPDPMPAYHEAPSAVGLFAALVAAMWAYDGWADLSSLAGETKNPGRTLPRALLVGTAAVGVAYLLANVGYARVLGLEGLRRSTDGSGMAAAHLATLTLGAAGRALLAALVLVSCVGGCMASLLTNSRTFVPMATDGVFSQWLGRVWERTGVPANAIGVGALLGAIYVSSRSFEQLTDAFVVGYFPFYALAVIGLFRMRRKEPELPRPFRVPLHPLPAIVFLAGAACVMAGATTGLDGSTAIATAVILAGVPVSFFWIRGGAKGA